MNKLQRILLATLVVLACIGGGIYYLKTSVRLEYSARTKFQILPGSAPNILTDGPPGIAKEGGESWLDGEVALISSREILTRVEKGLNLGSAWHVSPDEAVTRLEKQVTVTLDNGTENVTVAVSSDSPDSAADIANSIRTTYVQIRNEKEQEQMVRLAKDIEARLQAQQKEVDAAKAEMEAQRKKHGIRNQAL